MRLLHTSNLTFHEYFNESVPPYGILSHTWAEGQEVSYQGMLNISSSIKAKSGYSKIINCAQKIKERGYDYVWIDTCCIDKSSSAELSESINSMYHWYKNSMVCLAYMADVHRDANLDGRVVEEADCLERYPTFQMSRWFMRGWTLQELIAPPNVVFYDSEWEVIAQIKDIAKAVERFTGIPVPVLLFGITDSYCVAEKMKWASQRRTTRREDMAYCLLGFFDINMPLLYGEGDKAFERLQEEILKRSGDLSLFLWQDPEDSEYVHRGLLTRSPAEFANFSMPRKTVDLGWTVPEHFDNKTWITPKHPCWITNIGVQLSIQLLPARDFYKLAAERRDWDGFFDAEVKPRDDEYAFNVINFMVGPNLFCFYILLKRLEMGGNQFARLLPGRILRVIRLKGRDNHPPAEPETIFVQQNLKVQRSIADPRIYGFSIMIRSAAFNYSLQEGAESFGPSCSGGLMGRREGQIFRAAVVSDEGIACGFLVTLHQGESSRTFCVLVNLQPWLDLLHPKRVQVKFFEKEAAPGLCSVYSFSHLSPELEGLKKRGLSVLAFFRDYIFDTGRLLAGISINLFKLPFE